MNSGEIGGVSGEIGVIGEIGGVSSFFPLERRLETRACFTFIETSAEMG